ncbi:hypothetical protein PVAP13_1NG101719 [Panicum virgatum]|uniref:Uncharacterized protein n=1 Tax=Panicum virgatum TaxID=38727 RepID=A0A8T0WQA0_PANVG|nr:hypothetical protein PVAP13_1NG101719 [Panicum virgatum]
MAVRHRLMALAWLAAALWLANAVGGCLGHHVPPPSVGAACPAPTRPSLPRPACRQPFCQPPICPPEGCSGQGTGTR